MTTAVLDIPPRKFVQYDEKSASRYAVAEPRGVALDNLLHPFLPSSSQKVSDWLGTTPQWKEQSVSVKEIPSDISILFSKSNKHYGNTAENLLLSAV